jgi:hypothetical protein
MSGPQVADGGDGLQILRVAANMLNKQARREKEWSSSLGVGRGATKISLLRNMTKGHGLGRIVWINDLS